MTAERPAGEPGARHRFYGDLAPWWPLISPPEEYREEAAQLADVLRTARADVHDVLELGSGGGHNAIHLSGLRPDPGRPVPADAGRLPPAQPGLRAPGR